jgi:hypothetical protein
LARVVRVSFLFLFGAVITFLSGLKSHKEHDAADSTIDILDLPIFTTPKCIGCEKYRSCQADPKTCNYRDDCANKELKND